MSSMATNSDSPPPPRVLAVLRRSTSSSASSSSRRAPAARTSFSSHLEVRSRSRSSDDTPPVMLPFLAISVPSAVTTFTPTRRRHRSSLASSRVSTTTVAPHAYATARSTSGSYRRQSRTKRGAAPPDAGRKPRTAAASSSPTGAGARPSSGRNIMGRTLLARSHSTHSNAAPSLFPTTASMCRPSATVTATFTPLPVGATRSLSRPRTPGNRRFMSSTADSMRRSASDRARLSLCAARMFFTSASSPPSASYRARAPASSRRASSSSRTFSPRSAAPFSAALASSACRAVSCATCRARSSAHGGGFGVGGWVGHTRAGAAAAATT